MRTYVRDLGGPPGARLQRALAAGNLVAAEQAAFEVAFVPLTDARALVELYAEKGDRKYEPAALRYLRRYLDEANPSLVDVAQVAALLAERDLMMRGSPAKPGEGRSSGAAAGGWRRSSQSRGPRSFYPPFYPTDVTRAALPALKRLVCYRLTTRASRRA